ncbi:MAG: DUF1214 domain-containing protein [Bacteroides sp.]|nr:DUF1214 domain-containing protein [Bacteroides sp.]
MHFDKEDLPPAQAFWSYTVYDEDRYLTDNPINRYAIGDRNELKYNPDGSLDLYLSHKAPEESKISNWLPVPDTLFNVTARLYIPAPGLPSDPGAWKNPSPEKLK